MAKLSGQTIRALSIIKPFCERTEKVYYLGMLSYGVGPAGYDVRVEFDNQGKQKFIEIPPQGTLLASTVEHFTMPNNVIACVHDKSTWARTFLTVQNTIIEPGWKGYLTLELINHSIEWVRLEKGMPIAHVVFDFTDQPVQHPYKGKYQNQTRGPVAAL